MEAIHDTMNEMMELFRTKTAAIDIQLQNTTNTTTVESSAADFTTFKSFMMQAVTNLQKQIEMLVGTMDRLEMQSRRKILLIHGINEVENENVIATVTEVIKKRLGFTDFTGNHIKRCHRMGRLGDSQRSRPILIKFQNVSERDKVWLLKTKLKNSGITISEFLTKLRHDIFMAARKKFGLSNCWTREGHIFVKGPNDTRHRISSLSDLNQIRSDEIPKQIPENIVPLVPKAPIKTKRAATNRK